MNVKALQFAWDTLRNRFGSATILWTVCSPGWMVSVNVYDESNLKEMGYTWRYWAHTSHETNSQVLHINNLLEGTE